jgi:hypothetical protein
MKQKIAICGFYFQPNYASGFNILLPEVEVERLECACFGAGMDTDSMSAPTGGWQS